MKDPFCFCSFLFVLSFFYSSRPPLFLFLFLFCLFCVLCCSFLIFLRASWDRSRALLGVPKTFTEAFWELPWRSYPGRREKLQINTLKNRIEFGTGNRFPKGLNWNWSCIVVPERAQSVHKSPSGFSERTDICKNN